MLLGNTKKPVDDVVAALPVLAQWSGSRRASPDRLRVVNLRVRSLSLTHQMADRIRHVTFIDDL
jgi:hypothetical protein